MKLPLRCKQCGKPTRNPKFCSKVCADKFKVGKGLPPMSPEVRKLQLERISKSLTGRTTNLSLEVEKERVRKITEYQKTRVHLPEEGIAISKTLTGRPCEVTPARLEYWTSIPERLRTEAQKAGAKRAGEKRTGITMPPSFGENISKAKRAKLVGYIYADNRDNPLYFQWRSIVKARDGYTCQHCGKTNLTGLDCQAHHIYPVVDFPEYWFDNDKGLTLCNICHKKEDRRLQKDKKNHRGIYVNFRRKILV